MEGRNVGRSLKHEIETGTAHCLLSQSLAVKPTSEVHGLGNLAVQRHNEGDHIPALGTAFRHGHIRVDEEVGA
jgi:hypothetical protein